MQHDGAVGFKVCHVLRAVGGEGRYVGSARGDSQLVRLSATPVGGSGGATPSFLEVLENYTSLGPIVDFAVVDLERQGQGQVTLVRTRWPPDVVADNRTTRLKGVHRCCLCQPCPASGVPYEYTARDA